MQSLMNVSSNSCSFNIRRDKLIAPTSCHFHLRFTCSLLTWKICCKSWVLNIISYFFMFDCNFQWFPGVKPVSLLLWSSYLCFLSHQLLTQCNTRFVECFSAHKDCNKEKNRNSSVVPCEYLICSTTAHLWRNWGFREPRSCWTYKAPAGCFPEGWSEWVCIKSNEGCLLERHHEANDDETSLCISKTLSTNRVCSLLITFVCAFEIRIASFPDVFYVF